MTNPVPSKNGYTLIEILVAISILSILFVLGYAGFRDFSRRQALTAVARSVKTDLRFAQESAFSGNKPGSSVTNFARCQPPANVLNGYDFKVTSLNTYTITANCSPNGLPDATKTVTIPNGFTISTPSTNPITFKAIGQGTKLDTAEVTITITQAVTNSTQVITVTSGGEIR